MTDPPRVPRGTQFPIVEAFGYFYDSDSSDAAAARAKTFCRFSKTPCEKYRQYGYGYCSVTYAAEWDGGQPRTYAVCDHRLDGDPVEWAVKDHFGDQKSTVVPEVTITTNPKLNVDYVAFREDARAEEGMDLIAIETQAIDLRGGGVGPAWTAWMNRDTARWREYFTAEATTKNRRDTVDYGVNVGNVYKRLGTQVAVKGEYFQAVHVPLYVITQHTILERLRARVDFETVCDDGPWDITFVSFEYESKPDSNGRLPLLFREAVRTTLEQYRSALTNSSSASTFLRSDLIAKVRRKLR